jgi:uncharacterized protein YecA (UPF0149 family)
MKPVIQKTVRPFNCGKSHDNMPVVNISKPRRNDPCPCGSGIKFKRCCLLNK